MLFLDGFVDELEVGFVAFLVYETDGAKKTQVLGVELAVLVQGAK